MAEYSSNSYKARDGSVVEHTEEKKIISSTPGSAVVQKKTGFGRFLESMIVTSASELGTWLFEQVIIPKTKDLVRTLWVEGIDMLLYGKSVGNKSGSNITKISYNGYYSGSSSAEPVRTNISNSSFGNIVFNTRGKAEETLAIMADMIDRGEVITVAQFYEIAEVEEIPPYTANSYGWTNLGGAKVQRCLDGGYIITLPRIKQL